MYGLIYKDFCVNKKSVFLFLLGVVLLNGLTFFGAVNNDDAPENVFLFKLLGVITVCSTFQLLSMLEASFFDFDERKKWAYYITSTESGIKAQIGEKYIITYLLCAGGVILCNTINTLAVDLADSSFDPMSLTLVMFYLQMLLRAIDLPFTVAFGSKRGSNVRGVILVIAIFAVAIYMLFGDLSVFGSSMDDFWDKFFKILNTGASTSTMIALIIAALAVMPLYYLSYRISCKLYLKGVDRYEK